MSIRQYWTPPRQQITTYHPALQSSMYEASPLTMSPTRGIETMARRALRAENLGKFVVAQFISYNDYTTRADGIRERIAPGAFSEALVDGGVIGCLNHDLSKVIGKTDDDTLFLFDTPTGMRCVLDPNSIHASRHGLRYLVRFDAVTGISFCYRPTDEVRSDDGHMNTVLQGTLSDVAVLTGKYRPSYRKGWIRFTE